MGLPRILSFLAGLSSLLLLSLPELKKWQQRQIISEKLRLVTEALEQAEERVSRSQERHDRILVEINSHYVSRREMDEALAGALRDMDEALAFSNSLRRMQLKILSFYPCGVCDVLTTTDRDV